LVGENLEIYLSIEAGGYCYRDTCVFWDVGGVETLRLAAHEGFHQFLGSHNAHLPMWLEEGLAVCCEGMDLRDNGVVFEPERNILRMDSLRTSLINRHIIPVEQLVSMDAGDAVKNARPGAALEYYGQLWALSLYLQSSPQNACRHAANHRRLRLRQGACGVDPRGTHRHTTGPHQQAGRENGRQGHLPPVRSRAISGSSNKATSPSRGSWRNCNETRARKELRHRDTEEQRN